MSNPKIDAALMVQWPAANNAADTTHERGVIFRITNVNTSTTVGSAANPIPKNLRGRYWRMLTTGVGVDWGWLLENGSMFPGGAADAAPTLVYGQTSAMNTGNLAAQPNLPADMPEHVMCPPNAYALVFISATSPSGSFEASVSSKKISHNP
jgi:hypothetical protein